MRNQIRTAKVFPKYSDDFVLVSVNLSYTVLLHLFKNSGRPGSEVVTVSTVEKTKIIVWRETRENQFWLFNSLLSQAYLLRKKSD